MQKLWIAPVLALLAAAPLACAAPATSGASAEESAGVMKLVHQFVDGFNQGDAKAIHSSCSDDISILDELPPYEWHGKGALSKWMDDYAADAKKQGITEGLVIAGTPLHVDVTADRAYVVVPANYTFKMMGKPVTEHGSLLTVALKKEAGDWRITGWSWTKT